MLGRRKSAVQRMKPESRKGWLGLSSAVAGLMAAIAGVVLLRRRRRAA